MAVSTSMIDPCCRKRTKPPDPGRASGQAFPIVRRDGPARGSRAAPSMDRISLQVPTGETLGLVGESRLLARRPAGRTLPAQPSTPPDGRDQGLIFRTVPGRLPSRARISTRCSTARAFGDTTQMIFQDPYCVAQPAHDSAANIIGEPLSGVHGCRRRRDQATNASATCSAAVGLHPEYHRPLSARVLGRPAPARRHRPRARARSPSSSSCDEPISALDVSIQAAGHQPARGPAGAASASPTCSSPSPTKQAKDNDGYEQHRRWQPESSTSAG